MFQRLERIRDSMEIVVILIAIEVFVAIVVPILLTIHSAENDYEDLD